MVTRQSKTQTHTIQENNDDNNKHTFKVYKKIQTTTAVCHFPYDRLMSDDNIHLRVQSTNEIVQNDIQHKVKAIHTTHKMSYDHSQFHF